MLFPGEGNGTLLQYSRLENPMDGGARWAAVHGVAKGLTRLSDLTFTFHFHALEKEMATHSGILAWMKMRLKVLRNLLEVTQPASESKVSALKSLVPEAILSTFTSLYHLW